MGHSRPGGALAADEAPLAGVRVVEFGQYIAVPAAGQALRDLGADVIKVESPQGDAARRGGWSRDDYGPMFLPYNRGKRSIVLDLGSPQGRAQALRLATGADVVLQNARPGAMVRAGLGPQALRAATSRLVVGSVSGFGAATAFAGRVGLDIAAQAESGLMSLNGAADGDPIRVGYPVVDILTAQALTSAVLAALLRRGISGAGATIELALLDVAAASMAYPWAEYARNGRMPRRSGNGQPSAAPAADVIGTADGAVVLSAYIDAHFVRLAQALGLPALALDPRYATNSQRVAHRPELLAELRAALSALTSAEVCARLGAAGVVVAAVRDFSQVRQEPNGLTPGLFRPVHAAGLAPIELPGTPFRIDGLAEPPARVPGLGEHTDEILAELAR